MPLTLRQVDQPTKSHHIPRVVIDEPQPKTGVSARHTLALQRAHDTRVLDTITACMAPWPALWLRVVTPRHVLTCLAFLVRYLNRADAATGKLQYQPAIAPAPEAMRWARKLLFVRIRRGATIYDRGCPTKKRQPDMWLLGAKWRIRLPSLGIDPGTFQIVDQHKFNLAWAQLSTERITRGGRARHSFRIAEHLRAMELGTSAPPAHPHRVRKPAPIQHWVKGRRINRIRAEAAANAKANTHAGGPAPVSPQPFAWTNLVHSWRKQALRQN